MNTRYIQHEIINPILQPYIASMFIMESDASPTASSTIAPTRVIPNGRIRILINFHDVVECIEDNIVKVNRPRAAIIGLRSRFSTFSANGALRILGIEFFEHAAFRFFRAPMYELTNRSVYWNELRHGDNITDRIRAASSHHDRFRIVEAVLLSELNNEANPAAWTIQRCIHLLKHREARAVEEIALEIGLTSRHMQRLFKRFVGVSPLKYGRIARIERAVKIIARDTSFNSLDFALENGFYDQAHFNRDFKSIVGVSPGDFAAELRPAP